MTELSPEKKSKVDEFTFRALKHLMASKGRMRFRVATASMAPVIRAGDEIEVVALDKTPAKFDIVVFWTGELLMCHYVLHVNTLPSLTGENLFVTAGLNNSWDDWPVTASHVLGVVKNPSLPIYYQLKMSLKRWAIRTFLKR